MESHDPCEQSTSNLARSFRRCNRRVSASRRAPARARRTQFDFDRRASPRASRAARDGSCKQRERVAGDRVGREVVLHQFGNDLTAGDEVGHRERVDVNEADGRADTSAARVDRRRPSDTRCRAACTVTVPDASSATSADASTSSVAWSSDRRSAASPSVTQRKSSSGDAAHARARTARPAGARG